MKCSVRSKHANFLIPPHNLWNDEKGIYYIRLIKSVHNNNAIYVSLFSSAVLVACIVSEFVFVTPKVRSRRTKRCIFHRFTWAISFCILPEICYIASRIFGLNLRPVTPNLCSYLRIPVRCNNMIYSLCCSPDVLPSLIVLHKSQVSILIP